MTRLVLLGLIPLYAGCGGSDSAPPASSPVASNPIGAPSPPLPPAPTAPQAVSAPQPMPGNLNMPGMGNNAPGMPPGPNGPTQPGMAYPGLGVPPQPGAQGVPGMGNNAPGMPPGPNGPIQPGAQPMPGNPAMPGMGNNAPGMSLMPHGNLAGQAEANANIAEPVKPKLPETLLELAAAAMDQKRETQGLGYLMADALVHDGGDVLTTLRWSSGLKEPKLVSRWGLATILSKPSTQGAELGGLLLDNTRTVPGGIFNPETAAGGGMALRQPRPAGQNIPNRNPGRGNLPQDASGTDPIVFWREAVGVPLQDALKTYVERGNFGEWLKGAGQNAAAVNHQPQAGLMPGQPNPAQFPGMPAFPQAGAPQNPVGGKNPWAPPEQSGVNAVPGMVFLEEDSRRNIIAAAEKEQLDLLLLANVSVRPNRRGVQQSVVVLHIIDVAKNKELWTSRPLNSYRVEGARKAGEKKGTDPTGKFVKDATRYIDRYLQLIDMPKISHDAAVRRATALSAKPQKNPLPSLMELRYYQWKKILTDEEFAEHVAKLVGPDKARQLATGSEAERLKVVKSWLQESR